MSGNVAVDLGRLRFVRAGPDEMERLADMALDIWHRHYSPDILSLPEIDYLWQRTYRPETLRDQVQAGSVFQWIEHNETAVGFLSYRHEPELNRLWLSKLYVLPEYHGHGVGGCALAEVKRAAIALGVRDIRLYVFRKNERAVRAYRRAGYEVVYEDYSDAGCGFFYDDYVMSLTLATDHDHVPNPVAR
jgi:RimJ/RimL family protein N-acetyltransferase